MLQDFEFKNALSKCAMAAVKTGILSMRRFHRLRGSKEIVPEQFACANFRRTLDVPSTGKCSKCRLDSKQAWQARIVS